MTDDVSIVEALGRPVKVTRGSYTNIKVIEIPSMHHLASSANDLGTLATRSLMLVDC